MENWFENLLQGPPGSLQNTKQLSESFENPHKSFNSIHIAGTNGKGSVTYKSANVLYQNHYKVGIFTSPHIHSPLERIQINFDPIPSPTFFHYASLIKSRSESLNIPLGWFDLYTLIAFLYFKDSQVDWACIEVGLGGLLDNTNLITPSLSIIVSIGYDHMNILGSSLEEITVQKAGIIKPGVPCVYGPSVIDSIITETCQSLESQAIKVHLQDRYYTYDMENQEITRVALNTLVSSQAFNRPLQLTGLELKPSCRMQEYLINNKTVIVDVSHNISGIHRLISDVQHLHPDSQIFSVFAAIKGKETDESLQALRSISKKLFIISGSSNKLKSIDELIKSSQITPDGTGPASALIPTLLSLQEPFLLLITGTFAIMPDILPCLIIPNC